MKPSLCGIIATVHIHQGCRHNVHKDHTIDLLCLKPDLPRHKTGHVAKAMAGEGELLSLWPLCPRGIPQLLYHFIGKRTALQDHLSKEIIGLVYKGRKLSKRRSQRRAIEGDQLGFGIDG